jgi:hypothetical protein
LKAGDTFDQRFDKIGDVPLYCQNHGDKGGKDMAMVVHVVAASAAAQSATTVSSVATLPPTAPTQAATSAALDPKTVALNLLIVSAPDTPHNTAYLTGANQQMALIKTQAAAMTDALGKAQYEEAQAAAEAILNIIEGGAGKDRDGDGKINQPGDGYGLKPYIFSVNETANTLQNATNASDALHNAAVTMQSTGPTLLKDLNTVSTQAQALLDAKTLVDARKVGPALTDAVKQFDTDLTQFNSLLPNR